MSPKPYAEIRRALVEGIRNNPDKQSDIKHAAEVLISTIDGIHDEGENADNHRAFLEGYRRFYRAVHREHIPTDLEPGEIAQRLGLLDPDRHQ